MVPSVQAQVVKKSGEAVSMTEMQSVQAKWVKELPGVLEEFLEKHSEEQGWDQEVVLDDVVVEKTDLTPASRHYRS